MPRTHLHFGPIQSKARRILRRRPSLGLPVFLGAFLQLACPAPAAEATFNLPAPVEALVGDEARMQPLEQEMRTFVEQELSRQPEYTGAALKLRLGMRVHLAIRARNGARAVETAARIRALQTDPAQQAYTGLSTQALVATWDITGKADAEKFRRNFAALLAALPKTPEMRAMLVDQRKKTEAMTAESLQAATTALAHEVGAAKSLTLEQADNLLRLHHRTLDMLPLRSVLLAALDEAIAARPGS